MRTGVVLAVAGAVLGGAALTGGLLLSGDGGGPVAAAAPTQAATLRAGDLAPGDCFTALGKDNGYREVRRVDCSLRHDGEVFARVPLSVSDFPERELPPVDDLTSTAETGCADAFDEYAIDGQAVPLSVQVDYAYPDQLAWHRPAERAAVCLFTDSEGPRTGSLRQDPAHLNPEQRAYLTAENGVNKVLRMKPEDDEPAEGQKLWNDLLLSSVEGTSQRLAACQWPPAAAPAVTALRAQLDQAAGHLRASGTATGSKARKAEAAKGLSLVTSAPVTAVRRALGLTIGDGPHGDDPTDTPPDAPSDTPTGSSDT
ncbi:septum formation family protein [Kitasatospora sp. NPDC002227]|uniref:septum formation family protein n=1 Tax=Kitasatospora sp. NPDC002227 TaxID=3154773 RepID=UPI0033202471